MVDAETVNSFKARLDKFHHTILCQKIFKHLEAGCLQVNLTSTRTKINQLKYTILYYITMKAKTPYHILNTLLNACFNIQSQPSGKNIQV